MLWLSVIPTVLFLFSGIVVGSVLLTASAILFGISHIIISYKNSNIILYECVKCGEKFVPTLSAYFFGLHTLRRRYLKCPHCGKKADNSLHKFQISGVAVSCGIYDFYNNSVKIRLICSGRSCIIAPPAVFYSDYKMYCFIWN